MSTSHLFVSITDPLGRIIALGGVPDEMARKALDGTSIVSIRCDPPDDDRGLFHYRVDIRPTTDATDVTEVTERERNALRGIVEECIIADGRHARYMRLIADVLEDDGNRAEVARLIRETITHADQSVARNIELLETLNGGPQ